MMVVAASLSFLVQFFMTDTKNTRGRLLHKESGFLWAPSLGEANRHHNHQVFPFSPGRAQTHNSPPVSAFQVVGATVCR